MKFSDSFIWGAATAAYQVEGAAGEDGRGLSVWDVFCGKKGKILDGSSGEIACDQYHRMEKDVELMVEMGIQAYRFSLSWSRILPDGTGKVNQKGIDYYNGLVDCLLKHGIEPFITLYHWDLPQTLQEKGGWLNPESVFWFGNYARIAASAFSDRVKYFMTFNEPQCFIGLGYYGSYHAPGLDCSMRKAFLAAHHVLMAHGQAVKEMRKYGKQSLQIGFAPTGKFTYPRTDRPEDVAAAKKMLTDILPVITEEDMELISQPIDFIGQNIYDGRMVEEGEDKEPVFTPELPGFPHTHIGSPVTPEILYWMPRFLYERYKKPVVITENGMSNGDIVSADGKIHDGCRIAYLESYLSQLKRAAAEVPVKAYFHWSLMDNFEWACGYRERFGLIYVDYSTQKRTIKDSGYWYRDVIASNGECLP